jgi:hypothetical protein
MRIVIALGGNEVVVAHGNGPYTDWGTPQRRRLGEVTPGGIERLDLPSGSTVPLRRRAETASVGPSGR